MLWFYLVQIYDLSITLYNASGLSMSIVSSFAHVHTLQLLAVLVHLNAKISQSTCPHWGAIFLLHILTPPAGLMLHRGHIQANPPDFLWR